MEVIEATGSRKKGIYSFIVRTFTIRNLFFLGKQETFF